MSIRTPVLAALTWTILTGGVARAQEGVAPAQEGGAPAQEGALVDSLGDEIVRSIARSVVRSVRRSIALGPTAGAFSAYAPSASEFDPGISFGLELELFRSRMPGPNDLVELVRAKAQEKLARIIADRFAGKRPDAATIAQLMREIAEEVKAEVLAGLGAAPRLLERPRLGFFIETGFLFGPADWLGQIGLRIGAGPVSIGPIFSVRFGDDTVARLGGELSLHLLPTPSPRSPVLDIFVRADFELHARDANDDQISLGVRLLLDVI